jgi:hypothetical protein
MFTTQHISQSTRQSETELRLGGRVAPVGPNPTAMLLRHAGADDDLRHPIPAIAMIDAEAPSTHSAPKSRMCRSGVKSTSSGNSPALVSFRPEGAIIEEVTSRRKEVCQRNLLTGGRKAQGTRWLQVWAQEARETGWKPHRKFGTTSGSSAEAPAGCSAPPRTQQCRKETWTQSRALGSQEPSRTLAACARRVGSRPSKSPWLRPGYAKFGIGTSRPTNRQHP